MVSNDFKEEKDGLLSQMFDESIKGFGIFWVISSLTVVFLVMISVIS